MSFISLVLYTLCTRGKFIYIIFDDFDDVDIKIGHFDYRNASIKRPLE